MFTGNKLENFAAQPRSIECDTKCAFSSCKLKCSHVTYTSNDWPIS